MNKYEKSLLNLTCDLELTEQNQIDFGNIKELIEYAKGFASISRYDYELIQSNEKKLNSIRKIVNKSMNDKEKVQALNEIRKIL